MDTHRGPVPVTYMSADATPLWRKMAKACINLICGRRVDQPCLLKAELLYGLLSTVNPTGEYKVNLVVTFYCTGDRGHAWLSRNGKPLPASSAVPAADRLTLIGETDKYRYLVKESNLQKWLDIDMKQCNSNENLT